jgi:hypothetical protein
MRDPKRQRCAMKAFLAALALVLTVASPSMAADLKEEIVAAEKEDGRRMPTMTSRHTAMAGLMTP